MRRARNRQKIDRIEVALANGQVAGLFGTLDFCALSFFRCARPIIIDEPAWRSQKHHGTAGGRSQGPGARRRYCRPERRCRPQQRSRRGWNLVDRKPPPRPLPADRHQAGLRQLLRIRRGTGAWSGSGSHPHAWPRSLVRRVSEAADTRLRRRLEGDHPEWTGTAPPCSAVAAQLAAVSELRLVLWRRSRHWGHRIRTCPR